MAQLGLKLEQELAQLDSGQGLNAGMAGRWGAEETARERDQWRPVRSTQMTEEQADVATARVVDIEDVEDFLIDLGVTLLSSVDLPVVCSMQRRWLRNSSSLLRWQSPGESHT